MYKTRKILCTITVLVSLLSFSAAPAFAEDTIYEITEDVAGNIEIEETSEASSSEENSMYSLYSDSVLNVAIPTTVSVTIDPFEVNGKGQIFSDIYEITNYGESAVLLTFTDIQVTFADDKNFEALANPFNENSGSELKSIYMLLHFGRNDIPPVVITDPAREGEIAIPLASAQDESTENASMSLSFYGSVNHLPETAWQDGDVTINLTYQIESIPSPVESDILLHTENGEGLTGGAVMTDTETESAPEAVDATAPELPSVERPDEMIEEAALNGDASVENEAVTEDATTVEDEAITEEGPASGTEDALPEGTVTEEPGEETAPEPPLEETIVETAPETPPEETMAEPPPETEPPAEADPAG